MATLTINGIPSFRYSVARESRAAHERARSVLGDDMQEPCRFVLVDKCGVDADREFWFDRGKRPMPSESELRDAFGGRTVERDPAKVHTFKRPDGEVFTVCEFRFSLHFTTFDLYQPRTQRELDDAAARRQAKRDAAERVAAPLFAGGAA